MRWEEAWSVGGARFVTTMTRGTRVSGGSSRGTLGTFISIMARRLGTKSGMRLIKFNAFRIDRETTERKEGPRAKGAVAVTTYGTPGFGTKGTLGSTVG